MQPRRAARLLIAARRADDRAEARRALERCLPGAEVTEADGVAALTQLAAERTWDALFLHLDLAGAGIYQALGALARTGLAARTPVVVLSAQLGPAHCRQLIRAGADETIGDEAIAAGLLPQLLANVLERHALGRERRATADDEQERARLALAALDDGLWDRDVRDRRMHWSDQCFRMLGYEPGAFEPTSPAFARLLHPDDRERVLAASAEHDEREAPTFEAEFRLRCADGSYRWILSRARSLYDGEGRMVRVIGFHIDIDAVKRAEHALARRSAGLALVDGAAAALLASQEPGALLAELCERVASFIGADLGMHYTVRNPGPAGLLELRSAVGVSRTQRARLATLPADAVANLATEPWIAQRLGLRAALVHPLRADGVLLGLLAFGSRTQAEFAAEDRRTVEAVSRLATAALERSRREARLRENEHRLRVALQAAALGTWEYDAGTGRIDCSPECDGVLGRPVREHAATLAAFASLVDRDDLERLRPLVAAAFAADEPFTAELRVQSPEGAPRWLLARGRGLRDDDGGRPRALGVIADVTPRKLAEQEREHLLAAERAARVEADRAGRLKDEFLATVSHELRTPLNSIVGWSRLLLRPNVTPELVEEGVRVIERNARVQAQLISDLLDVNRIASGKLLLELEELAVNDVARAALDSLQTAIAERSLHAELDLAPDLPPVRADPARLQQVIWNLLANAVKFTPAGGTLRLATRRVADGVEIEVADSGQGIAPEFLPHVFDRFRQADGSTRRSHGGLGLGLALVKQLVEMHGGDVAAHSDGAGLGAAFRVRVPAAGARDGPGAQAPLALDALRDVDVLLVDDQGDALEFMRRLLAEHGARVRTATHAEEALGILRGDDGHGLPALLVSDIGMPGMDGYQLLRTVRAELGLDADRLPAVAVTAFAREDDRLQVSAAGYQAHLPKPLQPERLIATLRGLAGERGSRADGGTPPRPH